MNPFDEWGNQRGYKNTATLSANFTGTLSDVSVDIEIKANGWYAISASVDFYWTGPSATAPTATTGCKHHFAGDPPPLVRCATGQFVSMIRAGSSGVYHVCKQQD